MDPDVRHYPGCEWICGHPPIPHPPDPCRCLHPRFRKYRGKPVRTCRDCQGIEVKETP